MKGTVFPRMHVSLYVSDLTATVNFYTAFFGQLAAKIKPGYAKYVLDKPSLIISFVQNPARVASNFGHLGFQVEAVEDMQQRLARAHKAGLVACEEMGTSCCYAKQDKFWANDPDGVEWEVYYFHEDAGFNDLRYQADYDQAQGSSQCCIAPVAEEVRTTVPMAFTLMEATPATTTAACTSGGGCC